MSKQADMGPQIIGVQSGKCMNVQGDSTEDYTRIDLSTCNGGAAQAITPAANDELHVLGKCLDGMDEHTDSGTPIVLYSCNGGQNQQWRLMSNGTIRGVQSDRCVGATSEGTADGTLLELEDCTGSANQVWKR